LNVDKNEWNDFYRNLAKHLYENGYSTLRFDFRGHGESGGSKRELTIIGSLVDLISSTQIIKKKYLFS